MSDVLLVAATERELGGLEGLVCGIGPVEAAAATARELAVSRRRGVLHIGVAGGTGLELESLVIGTEAVYCDLSAAVWLVDRVEADARLVVAARAVLPAAHAAPIGTSAGVGRADKQFSVEGMEGFGVLRAASIAGVPAVEIRAISNEIGEEDRQRWRIAEAIAALAQVTPALLDRISAAVRV